MKYTKALRDEAALICAIAASNPDLHESYGAVCRLLGIDIPYDRYESLTESLAFEAWQVCQYADHPDAEAEALIRSGWNPGGDGTISVQP